MEQLPVRIAVIGAGISGLTAAWLLHKSGADVTVFEQTDRPGGKIDSCRVEGYEIDMGPASCSTSPALLSIIEQLDLKDHVQYASRDGLKRLIYRNKKLHAISRNPAGIIFSDLLSFRGKISLLKDLRLTALSEPSTDETIASFIRRHFGEEVLQVLVDPMIKGIYAGNAEQLGIDMSLPQLKKLALKYGSVIKGAFKERKSVKKTEIISFEGGFRRMVDAMSSSLGNKVHYNTVVNSLIRSKGHLVISGEYSDKKFDNYFDRVVIATPSFHSGKLLTGLDQGLGERLKSISYSSVSQIFCEVELDQRLDGFGFLVPSIENMSLLGAICMNNVFPKRYDQKSDVFVLFAKNQSNEAITDFRKITNALSVRVLHVVSYQEAIPQFGTGHRGIVEAVEEFERRNTDITLVGNYLAGVSIGNCVEYSTSKMSCRALQNHSKHIYQ